MPRMAARIVSVVALVLALTSSGLATTESSPHQPPVLANGCCRN
jgi:hypothetical protein